MKYERLTEKDRYWKDEELWTVAQEPTVEEIDEIYNRLAELEDKIEKGTLVELPCKFGDTVYSITKQGSGCYAVVKGFIADFWFSPTDNRFYPMDEDKVPLDEVFMTKEEAEAKLKELEVEG